MSDSTHRAHRFDASLPGVLCHEGKEFACVAKNFSRTGLLLTGSDHWPPGETFQLILRSAGGDLQIQLEVQVVRRLAESEEGGPKLAVEFHEIDAATRERLEFLLQRVIEGRAKAPALPEIPPGARPHEIRKILDAAPLAVRVALAGHGGAKEREPLVHDQHPAVLEALARNPGLLALEARALAGSLHATSNVLTGLIAEGRFSADEELRAMVLAHAKMPTAAVERVAASIGLPALRRALAKSSLTAAARTAIQKRLVLGDRR